MVRNGKYSTGEIDSQRNDEIKTEFLKWLEKHPELGKMTGAELVKVMSKRKWKCVSTIDHSYQGNFTSKQ